MSNPNIFALDIGTRKIAGLIMKERSDEFVIEEAVVREQLPQAMQDGQIHSIDRVAKVIRSVKDELQALTGEKLTEAAVAAAGRSLITRRAESQRRLPLNERISTDVLRALEMTAVQQALEKILKPRSTGAMDTFLCVGYTVVHYLLDGQPIGSLVGHRGSHAAVEVIATFLPRIVVDSLGSSLEQAGLSMASLTLEPMAAMHTVIPATMRMLNLALVDIGAGTSDIAITEQGTIKAYGMVPVAGDEVTEKLAADYLLDFMVAENVKRQLSSGEPLRCSDVFGNERTLERAEVCAGLQGVIDSIVTAISDVILAENGKTPRGLILIGGGSLTPGLVERFAQSLSLTENLISIRERRSLAVKGKPDFAGPQTITPISIGCSHLKDQSMEVRRMTVNDQPLQFLRFADTTLADALLHAGYSVRSLMGRPGHAVTLLINEQSVTFPGTMGSIAPITSGGRPASLDTRIRGGETVTLGEPKQGRDAEVFVRDILQRRKAHGTVTINGAPVSYQPRVRVNGELKPDDFKLTDNDRVTINSCLTLSQCLTDSCGEQLETEITLNGQQQRIRRPVALYVNDKPADLKTPVNPGDSVDYAFEPVTPSTLIPGAKLQAAIQVTVNGKPLTVPAAAPPELRINWEPAKLSQVIRNGDVLEFTGGVTDFILSDIFRVFDPRSLGEGQNLLITVNEQSVGFTHPIKEGDAITFSPRPKGKLLDRQEGP